MSEKKFSIKDIFKPGQKKKIVSGQNDNVLK